MKDCNINKHDIFFNGKQQEISLFIYSYFFSAFFITGLLLSKNILLDFKSTLFILSTSLIFAFPISIIIKFIDTKLQKILANNNLYNKNKKTFLLFILIIFLLWFPVFLAYYPGLFNYDVVFQLKQKILNKYNTHHPLLHTVILNFFYGLFGENHNLGLVFYTIIQMFFLAFSFSYELYFIYKLNINKKFIILNIIWIAITPFFSILSISMTKDIFFTGFFIIFITNLGYICYNKNYLNNLKFLVITFFTVLGIGLFRNNGIYIVFLTSIVLFLKFFKYKKFSLMILLSLIAILTINGSLRYFLQAKEKSKNELFSIPYQQLARTYFLKEEIIIQEDKELFEKILPTVLNYNPYKADEVKDFGKILDNTNDFIKIYLKYLIKYPNIYIEAFLHNTMGYWYIPDTTSSRIYGQGLESRQGYIMTDYKEGFNVNHISLFPKLETLYENLFSNNDYQKIPLAFLLLSPSIYFWIIVFCIFKNISTKNKNANLITFPIIILLLTLFGGPCVLVRYAFPYISVLPILLCVTYKNKLV